MERDSERCLSGSLEQPDIEMLLPPPSHSESSVFQRSQSLLLYSRFMVHIYSRVISFSFPFNSRRNANKRRKQSCLLLFPARAEQLRHLKATNFIVVVRNGKLTARAEGKEMISLLHEMNFLFFFVLALAPSRFPTRSAKAWIVESCHKTKAKILAKEKQVKAEDMKNELQ